ncbi:Oxo-4-hydroxy-4-carboxy-5-ureidoimidazoline decarboxylase [Gilbertella persicaria]|uniref:Oxo-4-hydroxy-4-carboxy-5-ureidoimidazoline decarboxylase n=1 Tax=Gilbertella persicaria TaxID=101096 RepID=UPI00221EFA47|nr:Oxo-4-hydroxy-4-carboxy-5-ureidoimidazoline decarboxylase [Gilbertella persicaria]KAI8090135.1 Oxo-4-hydroxy-4-carboxy-5-ureidoimidazoline decarboxylase [Gilbertella persicaria]
MTSLPAIEQLNQESSENFIKAINTLFETAPPLARRLLDHRPYTSYSELIDYAEKVCLGNELDEQEKLEVMNAHPRIGASKAGLSANSLKEQGYNSHTSTLSTQDQEVNAELAKLNQAYEDQYGFKFVVFVNGRPRHEIIPIIKERMASNSHEKELRTGITDMMLIARDRLKKATFESSKI